MTLGHRHRAAPRPGPSPRTRRRSARAQGFPCATVATARLAASGAYSRAGRRLPAALPRACRSVSAVVHRRHGHLRARLDAGVLGHGQAATACTSSARTTRPRSASRWTRPRSTSSRDPDLPRARSPCTWPPGPRSTTRPSCGARDDVRERGPASRCATWSRRTRRCRSPTIEQVLQIANGPAHRPGRGREPAAVPRCPARDARIGFATSLPAFVYGDPPAGVDPCSDTQQVLHALPRQARHQRGDAGRGQPGPLGRRAATFWQPLDWMRSTWRAVVRSHGATSTTT